MMVMRCHEKQSVNTLCCTASTNPSCSKRLFWASVRQTGRLLLHTSRRLLWVRESESHRTKKTQTKKETKKIPHMYTPPPRHPSHSTTLSTLIGGTVAQYL